MNIKTLAVVGGRGQMGGLFVHRSREAGLEVRCLDTRDQPLTHDVLRRGLEGVDLALLAVPLTCVEEVIAQVGALLEPPQILADVASVKIRPLASMLENYDGPVVGTHPLFGSEPPENARVAITPGRPCMGPGVPEGLRLRAAMVRGHGLRGVHYNGRGA